MKGETSRTASAVAGCDEQPMAENTEPDDPTQDRGENRRSPARGGKSNAKSSRHAPKADGGDRQQQGVRRTDSLKRDAARRQQ